MRSNAIRWTGRIAAALIVILVLAAGTIMFLSHRALGDSGEPRNLRLVPATAQQLADAPRMLKVHGCVSCHGADLGGRLFQLDPKIATVYSPNLTRLAARVDDATLDRAIRGGIGHDGRSLVIMPSSGYQFLTDQESAALIAAIRKYPVTGKDTPDRRFAAMGRLGLALGKFSTQPKIVATYAAQPIPDFGPETAAGRHITAVNCVECHGGDLKGTEIGPGLVSADLTMVGAYDLEQFKALLRTGTSPSGKDLGLMKQVARDDFRHMTDAEIAATHAYLVRFANR